MTIKKICHSSIYPLLIVAIIIASWCWVYNIKSPSDLQTPHGYAGDGVAVYAITKAFASGEISPGVFKFISTLNAPFSANWNDYPFEDFLYFPAGVLAKIFGLSAGLWLYLLTSQLLAGLSFFVAAQLLNQQKSISASCAVLFAVSEIAFHRGVTHLTVTMYWHIPLLLVTLLWCFDPAKVRLSPRQGFWLGITTGLLAGLYNPYYWFIFLFLLLCLVAGAVYGKNRLLLLRAGVITMATLVGFLISNADSMLFSALFGKGNAVSRNFFELVAHGLRLPDLITPRPENRLHAFFDPIFSNYRMNYPAQLKGEAEHAYVGLIALIGLGFLVVTNTARLAGRVFDRVNDLYWIGLGIFSFGVVGGINYLLGAFGFILLRSTNRYSILFMAIGLLSVVQLLSSMRSRKFVCCIAIAILVLGLYDQLPSPVSQATQELNQKIMLEDKAVADSLEKNLPPGGMVFQLPVKPFPESGPMYKMQEYEHLRPWLWTKQIRFSYGTMKGRGDADWQDVVASKPADQSIDELNKLGFSALLVNRNALEDHADGIKSTLSSLGYELFINNKNTYGFKLKPTLEPGLPYINRYVVSYGRGFSGPEIEGSNPYRWADGAATMTIKKPFLPPSTPKEEYVKTIRMSFSVQAIGDRSVWAGVGSNKKLVYQRGKKNDPVLFNFKVSDLPVAINVYTDKPGEIIDGGETRKLAFTVSNLRIVPEQ